MAGTTVRFKVGEKVSIQFSGYNTELPGGGTDIRLDSIRGSGAMFDSIVQIELLTNDIPGDVNTVWQNSSLSIQINFSCIFAITQ